MPQAPRKDNQSQRVQDKEAKRARGALSCAECRRLKLKCDKTVPCSSCKRRGCAAICPNGSLITGQGTRFVLADTEKLHQKIARMSDRIRQLEDALSIAQTSLSGPNGEPHPLLDRELMKIKSSIELHSASTTGTGLAEESLEIEQDEEADEEKYIDAFGTLAIRDDGAATFYGRSAGQESLLIGEVTSMSPLTDNTPSPPQHYGISASSSSADLQSESSSSNHLPQHHGQQQYYAVAAEAPLPNNLATAAQSFPLATTLPSISFFPNPNDPVTLSMLLTYYLPPYTEGMRLIHLYLEQAPWFFGAVTGKQIEQELIPMWYEEEAAASDAASPTGRLPGVSGGKQKQRSGTSHDLALLFMVFCFGALTDMNVPAPPDNPLSDRFYQLTKVALTLDPNAPADVRSSKNGILDRPPSVATVQAVSLMGIYEGLCNGENSIESTWLLMGLATKLSQSIGLHRDSARWKLAPAEVQKRRALFWELFVTDCWQSLATGRLATFSLPFVDCELPSDPDSTISDDGSIIPSFPFWKARFGAECVSGVVQGTLTSRAPKYSIILDLDRKVRDMDLPLYANGEAPQGKGLAQTMSHFMPQNYRELTLLYIHRCFFAHAISSNPLDPVKSQYAPSFLAGYRSACTILAAVKQQFAMFPAQISRFWVLWTHAFSASVMLASVATHASRSKIAPAALLELKIACDLFEEASRYGGRAGKFLPILRRLQSKAQHAYRDTNSGMPPNIPNDIFKPSQPDEQNDELSIFSGKTHTVNTKITPVAAPSGRPYKASSSSHLETDSPQQVFTDNPSFAGVHPSLISELNSFQPFIREQVQNAYRIGGEVFGGGPMVVDPIRKIPAGQIAAPAQGKKQQQNPPMSVSVTVPQQSQQIQLQQLREQQMQRQAMLQVQQQQLERERQDLERQELERQVLERQEIQRQEIVLQHRQQEFQRQQAQQHELQRQQAQQEAIRRRQAEDQQQIRKRQELVQQQQRQEQYRQQLEIQQRQLEQQELYLQQQQHALAPQQPLYSTIVPGLQGIPVSSTLAAQMPPQPPSSLSQHQRQLSHSQSHPTLRQSFQQHGHQHVTNQPSMLPPAQVHSMTHITPQHTGTSSQTLTPQHTGVSHRPQHSMYPIPPHSEYPNQQPNSDSMDETLEYSQSGTVPPTPGTVGYIPETYKFWPSASTPFAMPVDPPAPRSSAAAISGGYPQTPIMQQPQPTHYQHTHYTPEGALRGIAADDRSLQETWQSYMNKVGSPRQFMDD